MTAFLGSIKAEEWFATTLAALPAVQALGTTKVWADEAPDDIEPPYVVFTRVFDETIAPIGGPPVAQRLRYQWLVIDEGNDTTTIEAAALAIGEATDWVVGAVLTGGYSLNCQRLGEIPVPAPRQDGQAVVWLGAEDELFVTRVA